MITNWLNTIPDLEDELIEVLLERPFATFKPERTGNCFIQIDQFSMHRIIAPREVLGEPTRQGLRPGEEVYLGLVNEDREISPPGYGRLRVLFTQDPTTRLLQVRDRVTFQWDLRGHQVTVTDMAFFDSIIGGDLLLKGAITPYPITVRGSDTLAFEPGSISVNAI